MNAARDLPSLIPVFPLPNVVLFPSSFLPLRIFERRYRAMLEEVLDSHGVIAMALLKPGWQKDYFGNPDVFSVVGVGRIVKYQSGERGNYHIVLVGERRAMIRRWVEGRPYRRALVSEIPEEEPEPEEREELRSRLRYYLDRLTHSERIKSSVRKEIQEVVSSAKDVGYLVDSIAYHYLSDPRERQAILEAPNAVDREQLLREFLMKHKKIQDKKETDRP